MLKRALVAVAIIGLTLTAADARAHRHHHRHITHVKHHFHRVKAKPEPVRLEWNFDPFIQLPAKAIGSAAHAVREFGAVMLPHPSNCPRTAFCGCGAADEVGRPNEHSLWLASNWFKFPRTDPAPMMAAVRPHHVFVLKEHIGGDKWLVIDHNSGHHQSKIHVRSIRGFTIVNPH